MTSSVDSAGLYDAVVVPTGVPPLVVHEKFGWKGDIAKAVTGVSRLRVGQPVALAHRGTPSEHRLP